MDTVLDGTTDHVHEVAHSEVYRSRRANAALAVAFVLLILYLCRDFTGSSGGGVIGSRRIPIAIVVASVLLLRTARRGVVVSPFGLEARGTLTTWRAPWLTIDSFDVDGPPGRVWNEQPLSVVMIDGSKRQRASGVLGTTDRPRRASTSIASRPAGRPRPHDAKSGWATRVDALRPFGSSHSSCRPKAVRSRK
jgi:hypothetical protein